MSEQNDKLLIGGNQNKMGKNKENYELEEISKLVPQNGE